MSALDIYQQALNTVSAAVLAGDFEGYIAQLDLPYMICTLRADLILHRPEELKPNFRNMTAALAGNGATHYERIAREATFTRPDRIEGLHFTHILAQGERVTAPWAARMALVRRSHGWKFSEAHYPFDTDSLPFTEDHLRRALCYEVPTGLPGFAAARGADSRPHP